jgi:mediator of RNA polymerase II transcription subunit 12
MWNLRNLLTHPHLQAFPSITQYIFDVSVLLSDHISEDVRKSLVSATSTKPSSDNRCAFIFGLETQDDGWLGLTRSLQRASSPQRQLQASNSASPQVQVQQQYGSGPAQSRRPSNTQQQAQTQPQGRYLQHQQPHNILSQQLQRMGSNGQNNSASQLQQMQQMQAMAQQRQKTVSPQLQRTPSVQNQAPKATKSSGMKQERADVKAMPYKLSRWEVLPESGSNVGGNETAISLSLFGARKA